MKFWFLTATVIQVLRLPFGSLFWGGERRKGPTTTTASFYINRNGLQRVADYQPGDRLKEHKYTFFCRTSKRCGKKVRLHTSTKTARHCLCWCRFSQTFFICWLNRPTCTTSNTDRQAGPSRRLPDITWSDMMTFVALALQMGHELKDTLYDYWSRLSYTIHFTARSWHETDFYIYCFFCFL